MLRAASRKQLNEWAPHTRTTNTLRRLGLFEDYAQMIKAGYTKRQALKMLLERTQNAKTL